YVIDHLIALELGGSNHVRNLWPEAKKGDQGSRAKDQVEDSLHALVCDGGTSLAAAQPAHVADWTTATTAVTPKTTTTPTTRPPPPRTAAGRLRTHNRRACRHVVVRVGRVPPQDAHRQDLSSAAMERRPQRVPVPTGTLPRRRSPDDATRDLERGGPRRER